MEDLLQQPPCDGDDGHDDDQRHDSSHWFLQSLASASYASCLRILRKVARGQPSGGDLRLRCGFITVEEFTQLLDERTLCEVRLVEERVDPGTLRPGAILV